MSNSLQVDATYIAALAKTQDPFYAFQPLPTQLPTINSTSPVTVAFGGNRAGKSDTGAYKTLKDALLRPNTKVWCCTVDEALSIRVQMAKIHNLLPLHLRTAPPKSDDHARRFYYNYTSSGGYVNCKFTLANGSSCEFKFYSQDVRSFQGEDLDFIWFDECPPKSHYDESTVRLWDRAGRALITCTATDGVTPWVRDIITAAIPMAQRYAPLARRPLPIHQRNGNVDIFYLWTTDNPHIDQPSVLQRAKLYSRSELELRLYGVPSNMQGLIYPSFAPHIHIRQPPLTLRPPPHTLYIHALDPHDRKPWCMGWYAFTYPDRTLHVLAEYPDLSLKEDDVAAHLSVKDYVRIIQLKEAQLNIPTFPIIRRVIDPNKGKTPVVGETISENLIITLSRNQLFYVPANDKLLEGHMEVREALAYDPTEDLSDTNQPHLFISPLCKNHITQISNYEFAEHRSDQTEDDHGPKETVKNKNKDFPDLLRYVLMYLKSSAPQSISAQPPKRSKRRGY